MTLTELIVSLGIFAILMVALHTLFDRGINYLRRTESMVTMQTDALVAITRIHNEAINSNEDAFKFSNAGVKGVVFASPLNLQGTPVMDAVGRVEWQRLVVYYLDTINGQRVLARRARPLTPPDSALPTVGVADVAAIAGDGSLPRQIVARNVTDLITDDSGDAVEIRVLLESTEWGRVFGVEMRTGLFFRN